MRYYSRIITSMQSLKAIFVLLAMTVCAVAFHEHTYAVWELRELLMERQLNLWELFEQLEYVDPDQRGVVYTEIEHIREEISTIIDQLLQHDRSQHP